MTPDRERDLERICQAALERPVAERAAFLAQACRGDEGLRRDAEALLARESAAASFLELPAGGNAAREVGTSTGPALVGGQRIGAYTILAKLGVGGMGEVYRARDTRLGRDVAIKVLPAVFTHDPERLARLEREARLLASLNHPNIATIHGVEHVNGIHALVLELVEGETLAERLQSRATGVGGGRSRSEVDRRAQAALPLADALSIARQIALALEASHEKGVIHRDLKPANVKIRPDGVVKVLDFGLAKAAKDQRAADGSPSSGLTAGPTREGTILGTAAYMSPEQARGLSVDRHADIWAFGCVLYELMTGRTAFGGATFSDTIATILEREPDWAALPASTPPPVRSLLRRCLQKDSAKRLRDIGDAGFQIEEALNEPASAAVEIGTMPAPKAGLRLLWMAALVGAVASAAATAWSLRRAPLELDEVRLEVTAPPTTDPTALAISPDGKHLVFAATTDGTSRLWVRPLNGASARPLAETDNARFPFWSPDSRSVGFTADGQLRRIDVDGGAVRVLVTSGALGGGTWNQDGTILFDVGPGGGLFRVSADGGEPTPEMRGGANDPWFPQFLPDHRHILYYQTGTMPGMYVRQLGSSDEPRHLLDAQAATYAASGHLLFVRQRTLFAQAFDPVRLELSGSPTVVAEQLVVADLPGSAALSASAAGPVVYRTGPLVPQSQFVWFDRSGKVLEAVAGSDIGDGFNSSLSPDGRRLAFSRFNEAAASRTADIWLLDLDRGIASRFTSDPMFDVTPVWSPDGDRLAFASNRQRADGSSGSFDTYVKPATGIGSEDRLVGHDFGDPPSDWSPDGRFILYNRGSSGPSNDLWAVRLDGDREPFPVAATMFDEANGQFSPDGKWIAFQSNESGQVEVYVQSFPGQGRRTRISRDGGDQARWRHDGKELFYLTPDNRLMAVPMRLDTERGIVDAGLPQRLFAPRVNGTPRHAFGRHYSVSRDGQRFLVDTLKEVTLPITVVLNWTPKP